MDLKSFISLFINHSFISCSLSGIIIFPPSFDLRSLIDSYVEKNRNVSFLVVFDQNNASVGVWSDEPPAAAHHPALQGSVDLFLTAYSRENEMYVTVHVNNM